jgi:hypothetical protein
MLGRFILTFSLMIDQYGIVVAMAPPGPAILDRFFEISLAVRNFRLVSFYQSQRL